jgi:hypothetical protein
MLFSVTSTLLSSLERKFVRKSNKGWAELGVYVVNGKINGRPSRQKDGLSPYEI